MDEMEDICLSDSESIPNIDGVDCKNEVNAAENYIAPQSMDNSVFEELEGQFSNQTNCFNDEEYSGEREEKQRLIQQVLELQNTLEDLSFRVDNVKEENMKLRSENQILSQYIENLMAASSVFQSTSPKQQRRGQLRVSANSNGQKALANQQTAARDSNANKNSVSNVNSNKRLK